MSNNFWIIVSLWIANIIVLIQTIINYPHKTLIHLVNSFVLLGHKAFQVQVFSVPLLVKGKQNIKNKPSTDGNTVSYTWIG